MLAKVRGQFLKCASNGFFKYASNGNYSKVKK